MHDGELDDPSHQRSEPDVAGTIGLRAVAMPEVATARATQIKKMRLTMMTMGRNTTGTPERHNQKAMNRKLAPKPMTAVR